jgi:ketosteroid isomerase-like protein
MTVPHENLEIARRGYEAYNAGDLETLRELYDPNVVMFHLEGWPEPGPSVGRDAVMRELQQLREAWQEGDRLELAGDLIEVGNQVLVREVWHGSGSGPDAVMEFSALFALRRGKIITVQRFWDHDEALEAAGLTGDARPRR